MNNLSRIILLPLVAMLIGCAEWGIGGSGEMVVSKKVLRQIDGVEMRELPAPEAAEPPTTEPTTLPATLATSRPAPTTRPMLIEEVRQLVMANNLDLHVELLNPTISKETLTEDEAEFEMLFTNDMQYSTLDQPTSSELTGSSVNDFRISPGLRVPLRTGGVLELQMPMDRFETNNQFSTLNPSYSSDVSASLNMPLLRGAGPYVNTQKIRVAFYAYQQTQARTKLEVIRVLTTADKVYWRLYAARQEALVRKQEYDLAVAQLDRARTQVRAGIAAQVEITRAESGVADRVEAIIIADNAVRDAERDLKRILNDPDLPMDSPVVLIPATPPQPLAYRLDAAKLAEMSLKNRMEMLDLELQIALDTANVAVARNDMLPLVTLQYTYNVNGLGGSFDDSFSMVRDKNFEDHVIGLHMEVPIGNGAARSRLRASIAERLRSLATKAAREATIRQEVFNAIDRLDATWQRIVAARQRVVLAARLVDIETHQFEQGLRTSTDVIDAQTNLANAKSSEITALTEYQIAQVDIAFATGTVLGASKIVWQPTVVAADKK